MQKPKIQIGQVSSRLLILNIIMVFVYFSWWLNPRHFGNPWLYSLLVIGEIYHIMMSLAFIHTVWPAENKKTTAFVKNKGSAQFFPSADIFIPVAGEPKDVIFETVAATKKIDYPHYQIYILNDGFVAGKTNWQEAEEVAKELQVSCITRKIPGGAKAGNINNAMRQTSGELIVIFDADMIPHSNFLKKTVPYFEEENIGFVQTPQFYRNYKQNEITQSAWEQQEFFFGPILKGKDRVNASFICGTNVVVRRKTINDVGGFYDKSITEDFLTSLFIHQHGWKSRYLPEVLAEGLAPQDLLSYYKQQTRWAKGTLEVVFTQNVLFKKGLTLGQKIQYFFSSLYYLNGLIIFIDMIMPLLFFFFGFEAVVGNTVSFAIFFIPYMVLNLLTPYLASRATFTYRALAYSHSSWFLQLEALRSVIFKEKSKFTVTPKRAQSGRHLSLIIPHISYAFLGTVGSGLAIYREGFTPAVATNIAWAFFNMTMFLPFIRAAYYG